MKKYDQPIHDLLQKKQGLFRTADFEASGIPRSYLSQLEKEGRIEKIAWGVYSASQTLLIPDEMHALQLRNQQAVFSHETALYLHGLSVRSPLNYSVTLPSGYHSEKLKEIGCKVYFVKAELHRLGQTTLPSSQDNQLQIYDLERTLCDVIRSRSRIDSQIFTDAVKGYVKKTDKNLSRLTEYARQFGVTKLVRQYIEVLL